MRRRKIVSDDVLIRDLKGRHLVEPSRRILAEAIALGGRLAPARKGLVAWIAELLFDSGLAPATAGVRSGASASERRLLYHCRTETNGEAQVDLRLYAVAGISGGSDTIVLTILAKDGNSIVLDGVPMPARKGRPASQ